MTPAYARSIRRLLAGALVLLGTVANAAELATLAPDNYASCVPAGKEIDAIFGDYVLRNDKIVAIVADPAPMVGRNGSRKWGTPLPGAVIDLTSHGATNPAENDLLGAFIPIYRYNSPRRIRPLNIPGEPHRQSTFKDESEAHRLPGRQPVASKRVALSLPYSSPAVEVRYTLEDGWPYVLIERTFANKGKTPLTLTDRDYPMGLEMGPRFQAGRPDFIWGAELEERLAFVYDPWFGQAYGVVAGSGPIQARLLTRRPVLGVYRQAADGKLELVLQPGETLTLAARLFPAPDLFRLRALTARLAGQTLHPLRLDVADASGPIADCLVTASRGKKVYAAGRTTADGALSVELPAGKFKLRASPIGREPRDIVVQVGDQPRAAFQFEPAAYVRAEISDAKGGPIPCKVEFRRDGAPDPFLFPPTGEHLVQNLYYTHTGRFRLVLPPGKYQAVVTHGPEFDAAFVPFEAVAGKEASWRATLERSVDTTGWVSANFSNRSTVSRTFSSASQLGRVLNLLAEHVEFAPATERDFISDFAPHLKKLGAEHLLATCPGIGHTQRVRKTWTAQNAFPVIHRPGKQDGGAPQRPQHVFQMFWLGGWYGPLTPQGNPAWTTPHDKLIQVTPPGIWRNDGRSDGMYTLFYPERWGREDVHRNGRFSVLSYMDAMEVQSLSPFLDLPAYDPTDPKGNADLQAWWRDLERRREANWPAVKQRQRQWLRILNLGYRIAGVVNSNDYYNFHGSSAWRNFVKSPTDDPAKIKPLDVVRAVRFGHVVMSTGPFLQVEMGAGNETVGPGDDLAAANGKASLHVRLQCPNWMDIDRVQVLFNGLRVPELNFTRAEHPEQFGDGVVKFERVIPLQLPADTFVAVIAAGDGPNLRQRRGPDDDETPHLAMSNPIWVDVGGNGFKPHSPLDDQVYTYLDVLTPLLRATGSPPAKVRLYLNNLGQAPASEEVSVAISPPDAAAIVGENRFAYQLDPGQQAAWDFELTLARDFDGKSILLNIPRSSVGVGRRAAACRVKPDAPVKPWTTMTEAQRRRVWWLPEHVPTRPPNWGRSRHAKTAD